LLGGTKQDVEEFNRTIFQDHRRCLHDRHPASPNMPQSQFGVSVVSWSDGAGRGGSGRHPRPSAS